MILAFPYHFHFRYYASIPIGHPLVVALTV